MRRSLAGRLAAALALVSLPIFVTIGVSLHSGFETRLIAADHDQLQTKSRLLLQLMDEAHADNTPESSYRRVNDMMRGQEDMDVTWLPGPAEATAVPLGQPYRRQGEDGVMRDAVDIALTHGPIARARLEVDTRYREARLERYATVLLGAGLAGVLLTSLLGALAAHWVAGNLRRLSAEARAITIGGRLDTRHVDDELGDLVAAFNDALGKLDNAYRQMEGFGADVAHELRSPLASAINGAQVTLSAPRSADALRDALASNLEEMERVAAIVNDMLFLARADQGERARSLERVDLADLVDGVLAYCGPLLDDAGATAQRIGQASAVCNPALIRRAIANLVTNAVRHADGARQITARVEALPGAVRISVFNTGHPVSPELAARMFDRFYRADASRSAHGDAARHGLGLTIVRAVAHMHGGKAWAEGKVRDADGKGVEGTMVGIELPGALSSGQQRLRAV